MTWALRRQIFFTAVFVVFISAFVFLVVYPSFNKPPSCTDGKQNGTESGVDCGGACERACLTQVDAVSVLWARAFRVVPGRYNAVAYLENHNKNTAAEKVSYRFRFADANNVYIGKREGTTFIPASGKFAVFEPAIDIGYSTPVYTTFEFTSVPDWKIISDVKLNQLRVLVSGIVLTDTDTSPLLSASVKNDSLFTVPDINVVAILYDENSNAVGASRTYIEELSPEDAKSIHFTWREALPSNIVAKEIIPQFNVFSVKLK
jgi:hypothetical protein